ncbi:protein MHF1 homolog isoform X2 [Capsicum annuum]|uniref:protein MHF1 homolog isoform X2 n=1 Tax=Capsicum annuum TaxID=4072 RepID=UPI0007BFAA82|nr:protein MHF1 homolog isoform X2 [Capsicum annuum]
MTQRRFDRPLSRASFAIGTELANATMLNNSPTMEDLDGGMASEVEREEEESVTHLLRDRFRLCTISIAEAEEQLSKDLELFAQHAGRKSVNMEDVILSAHRNDHLTTLLRSFCNDLKAREPNLERKRKKNSRKEGRVAQGLLRTPDT